MAPTPSPLTDADVEILVSCIKNAPKVTPKFEKVAQECGLKDEKAAWVLRPLSHPFSRFVSHVSYLRA
jgi:hypothetical protein